MAFVKNLDVTDLMTRAVSVQFSPELSTHWFYPYLSRIEDLQTKPYAQVPSALAQKEAVDLASEITNQLLIAFVFWSVIPMSYRHEKTSVCGLICEHNWEIVMQVI